MSRKRETPAQTRAFEAAIDSVVADIWAHDHLFAELCEQDNRLIPWANGLEPDEAPRVTTPKRKGGAR